MNHELAKQLKDAGFPQAFPDGQLYYDSNGEIQYACEDHGTIYPEDTHGVIPTLSELIKACGGRMEELSNLSHYPKEARWTAISYPCEECGWENIHTGRGSNPEEAVARLWLALKKA